MARLELIARYFLGLCSRYVYTTAGMGEARMRAGFKVNRMVRTKESFVRIVSKTCGLSFSHVCYKRKAIESNMLSFHPDPHRQSTCMHLKSDWRFRLQAAAGCG
jgi:hypothetical protein